MIQRAERDTPSTRPGKGSRPSGAGLLLFAAALAVRVALVLWRSGRGVPAPAAGAGPLVPWLQSMVERAAGTGLLGTFALPCVLGAIAALLLVAIGERLHGAPVAWRAGWIAAFDPILVFAATTLPLQAAFSALAALALLASIEWVRTPRRGRAVGAGLLWGLAALAHPLALWAVPGLAAWAWRPLGLALVGRERALQLVLVALGCLALTVPWSVRESTRAGHLVVIAERGGESVTAGRLTSLAVEGAGPTTTSRGLDPLVLWSWVSLPFAAWGAVRALRGARRWFQAVVPVLLIVVSIAAVVSGSAHPRTFAEPQLVLLMALAADDLWRRTRTRSHGLRVVEGTGRREAMR